MTAPALANVTFGPRRIDAGRPTYAVFADGKPAGEIRRTRRGTLAGGGWEWTVALTNGALRRADTVREAKSLARAEGDDR